MRVDDLAAVVDLQVAFLVGSLVTELGAAFVTAFYRVALPHHSTRAFVAADGDAIVGAAFATVDVARFDAHVKPRILLPLAAALAPPARWRLLKPLTTSLVERGPGHAIPAELLTLVVDGRQRQRGIGRSLLDALEHRLACEGIGEYRVAVRSQLDVARAFYQATGFVFEQELMVLARPMTYLTKRVPAAIPQPR